MIPASALLPASFCVFTLNLDIVVPRLACILTGRANGSSRASNQFSWCGWLASVIVDSAAYIIASESWVGVASAGVWETYSKRMVSSMLLKASCVGGSR